MVYMERSCTGCAQVKPVSDFYASRPARCKVCVRSEQNLQKSIGFIACEQCGFKPETGSRRRVRRGRDGRRLCSSCRDDCPDAACRSCGTMTLRVNLRVRGTICSRCLKDKNLRRLYGISLKEYETTLVAQGGGCAICQTTHDLVVDHDHANGKVRKVLCRNCNSGLGQFRDNPALLRVAANYLEDH